MIGAVEIVNQLLAQGAGLRAAGPTKKSNAGAGIPALPEGGKTSSKGGYAGWNSQLILTVERLRTVMRTYSNSPVRHNAPL
ncbi:hypothetical protein [Oceanidesulfovibrio marinus]|uniref:hypothetical protein n=1 Tax=Oceanidesulfovibrio marinus TaxID=370038 RepID=UPI0011865E5A|nr:hypothetical protein [Oceanidesulfovibrio marinus]